MKRYISLFGILQTIVFSPFMNTPHFVLSTSNNNTEAESQYRINQSIMYDIHVNFSLHNYAWNVTYHFLSPRLDNHTPYQEVTMLSNHVSPTDSYNPDYRDKYDNKYDQFNTTLLMDGKVSLIQRYIVKLNEIKYDSITDEEIGEYNRSDELFNLYTSPAKYYNSSDPDLISISNSIVSLNDNPVEKARKIYDWVSNYLRYDTLDIFTSD